jgi:MYXO-CTERM domain-containing protein
MKKLPWIEFISAGILATSISVMSMSSPAAAQVTTPDSGTQDTTTTTYETSNYDPGLWGLTGLLGLFGLFGRRKEENHNTRRDDAPVYRDPGIR